MKKGYNSSDIPQQQQQIGQEQTRRLYRSITENVRRLDDARGCANFVSDLFSPALLAQRSLLRENCERLIFSDPTNFGRKGEDILWRKVFYEVVSTAKRLKKEEYTTRDTAYLQCHINAGLGYYHHFISRLQIEFQLNLHGIVDFPIGYEQIQETTKEKIPKKLLEWAEQSVHRSLIFLGDLSRYKLEISPKWDQGLAIRYYLQASSYKPDYGIPHNQLGNLATGLNCTLDAVYHFMRCLGCTYIFEGTELNLKQLLEKNACKIEKCPNDTLTKPNEMIDRLIDRFLLLVDTLYFDKMYENIPNLCHHVLVDLYTCLSYSKPVLSDPDDSVNNDETSVSYLNSETIFKMVIICLMCIIKLKQIESKNISYIKAFLLALFSTLVQNVVENIQDSVLNISTSSPEVKTNGKKSKMLKLRRPRLKQNSDDSECSDSDLSYESSSESLSDLSPLHSSSDEGETKPPSDPDTEIINGDDSCGKIKRLDPMDLLELVADEGTLRSIKILCDWLIFDIALLKECLNSSKILIRKLVELLNIINIDQKCRKIKTIKLNIASIRDDYERIPLPEDIILKGVTIFKSAQEKIDWNYLNNCIIDPKDEALIRINKIVAFGQFLSEMKWTGIELDKKKVYFSVNESLIKEEAENEGKKHSDNGKLMKEMGQLWLSSEINNLEGRIHHGKAAFSPYLVVDVSALVNHTPLVKQLITSKRFIIIIPIVVLSALDDLKKESNKARESIRWLEAQFERGNRFMRSQRSQEHTAIPLIKYPKKKNKETFTFIQIIECCYYLSRSRPGSSDAQKVTLLTGNEETLTSSITRDVSYVGLTISAGINFELVTTFHQNWKRTLKGNNNK